MSRRIPFSSYLRAVTQVMALLTSVMRVAAQGPPDVIITQANVITVEDASPRAEVFAIRAGRFIAVGPNNEVESLAGPQTKMIHLPGKTIVPGSIDAHCHPGAVYPSESKWALVDADRMR